MSRRTARFTDGWDWSAVRVWLAIPLIAVLMWMFVWRDPGSGARGECARRYAAARTHADTLRVDRLSVGAGTKGQAWNCGILRQSGKTRP